MSKSRYLLVQKRLHLMISRIRRGRVKSEPCSRRKSEPIRAKFARLGS